MLIDAVKLQEEEEGIRNQMAQYSRGQFHIIIICKKIYLY